MVQALLLEEEVQEEEEDLEWVLEESVYAQAVGGLSLTEEVLPATKYPVLIVEQE